MKPIPFFSLEFQQQVMDREIALAFHQVKENMHFILGPELERFEKAYAKYSSVKYCVGVGNGFDAIKLSLLASGIKPGDEVIVPANTYIATWLAVTNIGAVVVPVEPDHETWLIDPEKIEEKITKKTKAIIPVHLYGSPCDMDAITTIAQKHSLIIVEDNAQAHGASWREKKTGTWGVANATSFYPTKNLGALGDGGAITTDSDDMNLHLRELRNYGFQSKNFATHVGVNSRLDELQAAFLHVKLKYLDQFNQSRRSIAEEYMRGLKQLSEVQIQKVNYPAESVYHLFVIRTKQRNALRDFLSSHGIETMIHYPVPPHRQPAYPQFEKYHFPITESLADECLSLPLWPGMTDNDIARVVDVVVEFFENR